MSELNGVVETPVALAGGEPAGRREHVLPVGEQLRAARLARGMSLADLAQALKLGQRQVEALEGGDWSGLPGQTFIRGFVRNYARTVQLEAGPLMAQLDAVLDKPADALRVRTSTTAEMPRARGTGSGRDRQVVILGLGLVVLAALAYLLLPENLNTWRESAQSLLNGLGGKTEAPAPQVETPAAPEPLFPPGATPQQVLNPQVAPEPPAAAETPAATPPSAAASPVAPVAAPAGALAMTQSLASPAPAGSSPAVDAPQLRFVFVKEAWVEVRDRSNKVIFSQRMGAGAERLLSGQGPLTLHIGYAPGVNLYWRGERIDLVPHTRGDIARLVLE